MNLFSLKDKVIIVTGGSGVLGSSFVEAIAEAGGKVVILGRNEKKAEARAAVVRQNGGNALALSVDVLNEEALQHARERILQTYGQIDGLAR